MLDAERAEPRERGVELVGVAGEVHVLGGQEPAQPLAEPRVAAGAARARVRDHARRLQRTPPPTAREASGVAPGGEAVARA